MDQEYYLTVDELADRLRLPRSWIYSRTREAGLDSIPRLRVGKYLRFEWNKVEAWLKNKQASENYDGMPTNKKEQISL